MKKIILIILTGTVMFSLMYGLGYAWGPATHVFIAKKMNKKFGLMNIQEMYGGIAPDIFSYVHRVPLRKYFEEQMHYEFMPVLNSAEENRHKAFALGFIGHNEVWGADYLARHEPGYASLKADQLIERILEEDPSRFSEDLKTTLNALIDLDYEHARGLALVAVESGVDLLIKRYKDSEIGAKIICAASMRDPNIPLLLTRVYARDEEERKLIIEAETKFRGMMLSYGQALLSNEKSAINTIAGQLADLAPTALCIILPDRQKLNAIGLELITEAMNVCRSDYAQLISATIKATEEKFKDYGIDTAVRSQEE